MARTISARRPVANDNRTALSVPEFIVFVLLAAAIAGGVYYYFEVYRKSPGFQIGEFFSALNAGDDKSQYAMLDKLDYRYWSTEKSYTKYQLGRGYTDRVQKVNSLTPVPSSKDPSYVIVPVDLNIAGTEAGKALYQTSSTHTAEIKLLMHHIDGQWKIVLSGSDISQLLAITPNPPGSNF